VLHVRRWFEIGGGICRCLDPAAAAAMRSTVLISNVGADFAVVGVDGAHL
jgi:hypothetical protein